VPLHRALSRTGVALLGTRGLRAIADTLVAASLGTALATYGINEAGVGAFATASLIGSATLVALGARWPHVLTPLRVLVGSSALMAVLGLTFALEGPLVLLIALAVIGPLNPSGGDVSAFLPAEQTLAADAVQRSSRTAYFALFSLVAAIGAAVGGQLVRLPQRRDDVWMSFWFYAGIGVLVGTVYAVVASGKSIETPARARLGPSRRIVRELALLFSLDAAGGGFVINALLAIWLSKRFDFDLTQVGSTFSLMALMSAVSALGAPKLVRRYGPIATMVVTHVPAQLCLLAAAFAPSATVAVVLLALRSLTSSLDVPARTAFVMNVVTEEERAAAATATNLPRSLAAAATPVLAGWMLTHSETGWPLVAGALCKLAYDALLWVRFRHLDATGSW
jgi:MFS family permease